tara:strand:+ start:894 stop:1061 length:168 start_codon:yes stop_codon:yes gene_type:complete
MMKKEEFLTLVKELIKEEVEKRRFLLEAPQSNDIDKLLTEKLSRIFSRKTSEPQE